MRKEFGPEQYFEDFTAGDHYRIGPVRFDEENILAFAHQFDPQPFHIDAAAAEKTIYGGLIASGWQVCSATFGALIEAGFLRGGGMGSPGIDELRWQRPVRPGDALDVVVRVLGSRPSRSRGDRGYVDLEIAALNAADETVMSYRVTEIMRRREPS